MTRLLKFKRLSSHAWYCRLYSKLTKSEIIIAENFIESFNDFSAMEFESKINRMFLDLEKKPKNYKIIMELLSCVI